MVERELTFEKRPWGEKRTELAPCFPQMLNFTNNITLPATNTMLVAYKYHLSFYKGLSLEIKLHFLGQELSSHSTFQIILYFYHKYAAISTQMYFFLWRNAEPYNIPLYSTNNMLSIHNDRKHWEFYGQYCLLWQVTDIKGTNWTSS